MSRATRAAVFAATVTLISSACGGKDSTPGKGGPNDPNGADTDISALCASACDNAGKAACDNFNPNCAEDCEKSFDEFPGACVDEVKAVFACYAEQTVICGGDQVPAFPKCAQTLVTLSQCVQANVEPDPTYGGNCLPGSSTPENNETYCGGTPETPLLYECSHGAPRAGCVAEPTGGHHLYCCPEI